MDHTVESEVRRLLRRVDREHGRLDLLVNDIWGGDPHIEWSKKFWQQDLAKGFRVFETAVYSHIITAKYAAPLLMRSKRGLLVEVTDGDSYAYSGTLFYDLVKTTAIRLAWDFAEELRRHKVAAVAVTPGFLRSEAMLDHFGVTEATWREGAKKDPNFAHSETPLFVGRAVAALAADPKVLRRSGRVYASWTLAKEYHFADADGSRPDWGAHFRRTFGNVFPVADEKFYRYWGDYERAFEKFRLPDET